MHSVLQRQLGRLDLGEVQAPDPTAWAEFLRLVEAAYRGHDRDRYLLERSMTLSSTEMRDLHTELRRDPERLTAVIDSLDRGLIVLDRDFQVELANPEAARIVGVPPQELRHWAVTDLLRCADDSGSLAAILAELASNDVDGPPVRRTCEDAWLRRADGQRVPVSASVMPVQHDGQAHGAVVMVRDVSERRQLELELRQAQKLEAVGRLAAGVAHEINTPMQFVSDNLRFIDESVSGLMQMLQAGQALIDSPARNGDEVGALAAVIQACGP
jgi:two-component system NtrC family sensor kinase